jgi:hypothetical protein
MVKDSIKRKKEKECGRNLRKGKIIANIEVI